PGPARRGRRPGAAAPDGPVADVTIPPGLIDPFTKIGWKPNKSATTWTYSNKAGLDGITKVSVKTTTKTPGLVTFKVTGKNGAFATTPTALPLEATFTLEAAGRGGGADFSGPLASCEFNRKQSTVKCK